MPKKCGTMTLDECRELIEWLKVRAEPSIYDSPAIGEQRIWWAQQCLLIARELEHHLSKEAPSA